MINAKFLFLFILARLSDETPDVLHDYCEKEYFIAECSPGKVVVIQEARYGRMELGTCILADFGYLNCYSNVLHVLDQRCSGRNGCSVKVSDLLDFKDACTEELTSYLQARYTCESVIMPDGHCCQTTGNKITLTSTAGLISNYVTKSSGCGGIDCPWVLETTPGQMFNISLFDFNTFDVTETRYEGQDRRCDIYAKINEEASGARLTVCSGETRHRHLYTSSTNSVEIQIVKAGESVDDSAYFLIAFQAFGCSNPKIPGGASVDRQGERAVIACKSNGGNWEIICRDGQWHGDFGECPEHNKGPGKGGGNSYFTREVYMVLVIAIAFVLAVAIVTTGIVCLYRHWNPVPSNHHNRPGYLTHMQTPDGTYLASEFNYSLPRHGKGYDTVGYKHKSGNRNEPRNHLFPENFRTNHATDKGYYSDHTYESPLSGHGQMANSGLVGCHRVNPDQKESDIEFHRNNDCDRNDDSSSKKIPGHSTFPMTENQAISM